MRSRNLSIGLTAVALVALTVLGTVTPATAQKEFVLHNFNNTGDGYRPASGLISDNSGNLYGTTSDGGTYDGGTVFEMMPRTGGGWMEKILHNFNEAGNKDGYDPLGGVIFDASGNLYGTTNYGGAKNSGTVFELIPAAGGHWDEKILYSFSDKGTGGNNPGSGLVLDSSGDLYGTTVGGGSGTGCGNAGCGIVFELTPQAGEAWAETALHSFSKNGTDGLYPLAGLIFDAAGNLYGTTYQGGSYGTGTVFELTPTAGGIWTETILNNFESGGTDGYESLAALTLAAGNIYGTTFSGGTGCASYGGCGTVFELTPTAGGSWAETVLHYFAGGPSDGAGPYTGLVFDAAGNLYGTTFTGGTYADGEYSGGTVFKLTEVDGAWTETVLHNFGNGLDGQEPEAGLIFGANGNLYGTTSSGGMDSVGTVFEITP
jgi:uncharacterized repeat protein (TIGR03803 family)